MTSTIVGMWRVKYHVGKVFFLSALTMLSIVSTNMLGIHTLTSLDETILPLCLISFFVSGAGTLIIPLLEECEV